MPLASLCSEPLVLSDKHPGVDR
ncbi:hypothetical protein D047_4771A, partial [Vibrio parahaemolyticus VPTS-2010_2]